MLWNVNSVKEFAKIHYEELKHLPEFIFKGHKWKFNDSHEVVSAQPLEAEEQYWEARSKTDREGNSTIVYDFRYIRCVEFLQNRGFGRYKLPEGGFSFIRINHPFVEQIDSHVMRDFVQEFTKTAAPEEVLEMLYRGGSQYLGPEKLANVNFIQPYFSKPDPNKELLFFQDKCWEITASSRKELEYSSVTQHVWKTQQNMFKVDLLDEPLVEVNKSGDSYSVNFSHWERLKVPNLLMQG